MQNLTKVYPSRDKKVGKAVVTVNDLTLENHGAGFRQSPVFSLGTFVTALRAGCQKPVVAYRVCQAIASSPFALNVMYKS